MGPTTITNNTCTDFSCNTNNTNVNTNINNSGNTSIAQVTPVYQTPVQYPVQYVFPQPIYPTYDYCPNIPGVQAVLPTGYYLQNGYCYQQVQPYVALSQIPYTGFDFGAAGNAIYWGALLSFALASGYLVLYYKGGAATFMGAMIPLRLGRSARASVKATSVGTVGTSGSLKTPAIFAESTRAKAPAVSAPSAVEAEFSRFIGAMPKDKMSFAKVEHGQAPRIIITRN